MTSKNIAFENSTYAPLNTVHILNRAFHSFLYLHQGGGGCTCAGPRRRPRSLSPTPHRHWCGTGWSKHGTLFFVRLSFISKLISLSESGEHS